MKPLPGGLEVVRGRAAVKQTNLGLLLPSGLRASEICLSDLLVNRQILSREEHKLFLCVNIAPSSVQYWMASVVH